MKNKYKELYLITKDVYDRVMEELSGNEKNDQKFHQKQISSQQKINRDNINHELMSVSSDIIANDVVAPFYRYMSQDDTMIDVNNENAREDLNRCNEGNHKNNVYHCNVANNPTSDIFLNTLGYPDSSRQYTCNDMSTNTPLSNNVEAQTEHKNICHRQTQFPKTKTKSVSANRTKNVNSVASETVKNSQNNSAQTLSNPRIESYDKSVNTSNSQNVCNPVTINRKEKAKKNRGERTEPYPKIKNKQSYSKDKEFTENTKPESEDNSENKKSNKNNKRKINSAFNPTCKKVKTESEKERKQRILAEDKMIKNRRLADEIMQSNSNNPFDVLKISKESNLREARKKYSSIMKRLHPDKNDSKFAHEAFIKAQKAFSKITQILNLSDMYDKSSKKNENNPPQKGYGILKKWLKL